MNFRVALFAAAALTVSGAAHAQTLTFPTPPDRIVIDIAGKPTPQVRAELMRAARAVCAPETLFETFPTADCVDATFAHALRQARSARAVVEAPARPTTVASR